MILELIPDPLKKKLDRLQSMGFMEAIDFKASVIASTLDNQTKFYAIDLIDSRLSSLDMCDVIAVCDDNIGFD